MEIVAQSEVSSPFDREVARINTLNQEGRESEALELAATLEHRAEVVAAWHAAEMARRPSADFRERLVTAIDAGLPPGEAAQRFRVSIRSIYRWLARHRRGESFDGEYVERRLPRGHDLSGLSGSWALPECGPCKFSSPSSS